MTSSSRSAPAGSRSASGATGTAGSPCAARAGGSRPESSAADVVGPCLAPSPPAPGAGEHAQLQGRARAPAQVDDGAQPAAAAERLHALAVQRDPRGADGLRQADLEPPVRAAG